MDCYAEKHSAFPDKTESLIFQTLIKGEITDAPFNCKCFETNPRSPTLWDGAAPAFPSGRMAAAFFVGRPSHWFDSDVPVLPLSLLWNAAHH